MTHLNDVALARERIDVEAKAPTGFLDLRSLDLDAFPTEISDLATLQHLNCQLTRVSDLAPLANMTALHHLDCSSTQVRNLSPLINLTALKHLDFSFSAVTNLSPLAKLVTLQYLKCRGVPLNDLKPLAELTALQHLDCSYTPLSGLSQLVEWGTFHRYDEVRQVFEFLSTLVGDQSPLTRLFGLQHLDRSYTPLNDLSPVVSLTALQHLNFSFTQVSDLSPLADLTALQHLELAWTQVTNIASIAKLVDLRQINCSNTPLNDISPLAYLTALQHLDCSCTRVSDLAPLANLVSLQYFDCSFIQATDLSPLANLTALRHLNCSKNQIHDLSPLSSLTVLRHIDFSHSQVCDLLPLAKLTSLQHINCWNTQATDLSPLANLTALQHIRCGQTQIGDLMPLANLSALQHLDCSECRLQTLPAFIRDNHSLKLIARNTHIPDLPPGLLSQSHDDNCRPRIQAHFDDLAQASTKLPDVKLLLLGNGGVGKTQIARWLCGESFNTEWDSTHGIQIFTHPHPDSIAARLHLQIWDLGGQDIYHGTHALFLRGPAILMPIWGREKENRDSYDHGGLTFRNHPLAYWLDVVTHQSSPDNPVLIVQNQCDQKHQEERRFPIDPDVLKALPYATELHTSPKTGRGRAALEESLQDAVTWLRDPNRLGLPQIGAGRLRVQRRLEALRQADMALPPGQRRHRLLEQEHFSSICAEEGNITSPALLLHYLDANGTVFYRPDLFSDRIVLDQDWDWALDAIYAVFDRKRAYPVLRQLGGRFSRASLGLMVWQHHTDAERKLLLSMMVSCRMCFLHREQGGQDNENDEYIAPDLLPERETIAETLSSRWPQDRPIHTATFRYALLHGGLIRAIMAEIGEIARADALYWRGGLYAFETTTKSRLLIEEVMTGDWQGEIRIHTQDGQTQTLLQKIIERVEQVQSRLALRPTAIERPTPPASPTDAAKLNFQPKQPKMPRWYVSYAWNDDRTPEGQAREDIVNQLCAAATAQGHHILRDQDVLSLGDSISAFMRKIGQGDRIFIILSDKYLHSPHCMFELHEVWRNTSQDQKTFLDHVRIYTLPDAKIFKLADRVNLAVHWKQTHDEIENLARQHGLAILGTEANRQLTQMRTFYNQVSDILTTIADIVQPRTFEQLEQYGFNDLPT